jgi:iron(III) transport system permease protein
VWLYIRTPLYATIYVIILVMLARFLPVLVRLFETGLLQLGTELDEAARVCGASEITITREIRLPLLAGTLRSATTIGGTQVFNELTASALLYTSASSVLPVVIFNYMFDGDYSRATALALLQIAMIGGLLALATILSSVWKKLQVPGAPASPPLILQKMS